MLSVLGAVRGIEMAGMVRRTAQALALASSPVANLGDGRGLRNVIAFLHALSGQGAGSGWDKAGETTALVRLVTAPRPVVVDVGANDGQWSLLLSQALRRPAEFHLFEVAPYCFPGLEKRMPEIGTATLVKKAISGAPGTVTLYAPAEGVGHGLASLHERRDVGVQQTSYQPIEVEAITLDSYAASAHLDRIDLLKMDIEGHELAAMRGASRLLAERRVRTLMFEFGSANVNSGTHFRQFWDLLTGNGYQLSRILPGGGALPIRGYTEELEYFRGATNYIATAVEGS